MSSVVWFNGHIVPYASLSAEELDRAWRYGDGGFETLFFNGTEAPLYAYHIRRATEHAALLGIRLSFPSQEEFQYIASALARENGIHAAARCRLSWFRDEGGLYRPLKETGKILLELSAFDPLEVLRKQTAVLYDDHPLSFGRFSPYKKLGAHIYVDAARHAQAQGADEALLLNVQGHVAEAVSSNIIIRKGDHFFAPPITDGAVEGVMLAYLAEHLPQWGYTFARQSVTLDKLLDADEILTVNALRGICCLILWRGKSFSSRSLAINTQLPLGSKSKT